MHISKERQSAIAQTLAQIQSVATTSGVTRETLPIIAEHLEALARRPELFSEQDFPPPPANTPAASTLYLLSQEPDETFALYLNAVNPGKETAPHNHTTWAVIVAIEGEELNRVYRRLDDGTRPGHAELALQREIQVAPGKAWAGFLADDIHSIHVSGTRSTRHFHLYGRTLASLTGRLAFDLQEQRVYNYNQAYYRGVDDSQRAR